MERIQVDFLEPGRILSDALRDPLSATQALSQLDDWREGSDRTLARYQAALPNRFRAVYGEVWRNNLRQVDTLRRLVENVGRVQELARSIATLNEPLGYSDILVHPRGRVRLAPDASVVDVHVRTGEYADTERPLITMEHRYRRNARAFLSTSELAALALTSDAVYEVVVGGVPTPPGIRLLALVHDLTPRESNAWVAELELFPAVETSRLIAHPTGLPALLPIQDRYCAVDIALLSADACAAASALLPKQAVRQISFRGKAQ